MSIIKKYDVGSATVDLPFAAYKHYVGMITFGGLTGRTEVGIAYNDALNQPFIGLPTNCFNMVQGMKLSIHKKIIGSSFPYILIDGDGSLERFYPTSNKDSNRELIVNANGTKQIRDKAGRVEYYNSNGDITEIRQYTTVSNYYTVMTYYYNSNKLEHAEDAIGRAICLTYTSNKISKIELKTSSDSTAVTKWTANITYPNGNVIVAMNNGVDLIYDFSTLDDFVVYTQKNAVGTYQAYCQKIVCNDSNNVISIVKMCGTRIAENIQYSCLEYDNLPCGLSTFVFCEAKDNIKNVRYRTEYKDMYPKHSYEVAGSDTTGNDMFYMWGTLYNRFKCDVDIFDKSKLLKKVEYNYAESNRACINGGSGIGTIYNFHSVPFVSGEVNYYALTGWMKPSQANVSVDLTVSTSQNGTGFIDFNIPSPSTLDTSWRFFHFEFALTSSPGTTELYVRQNNANFVTLGDVRLTHIDVNSVKSYGFLKKKNPDGVCDKVYLTDIVGCVYMKNMSLVTDNTDFFITGEDINNRLYNKKVNSSDNRLYSRAGSVIVDGCTEIKFSVHSAGYSGLIELDDYYLGQEIVQDGKTYSYYVSYSSGTAFRIVYETNNTSNTATPVERKYNFAGQILEEVDGVYKTEYTRNSYGLITNKKNKYINTSPNPYIESVYTYTSNCDELAQYVDDRGVAPTYTTDAFWGVVLTSTCNGLTKTYSYDTYKTTLTGVSQSNGTLSSSVDLSDTEHVAEGSDVFSLERFVDNSNIVCDNRIVDGRLSKTMTGSTTGSFAVSTMTYNDSTNSETDSYSARTKTFDGYDRIKTTANPSNELSFEYNVPEALVNGRPGYSCDKLVKITDHKASECTTIGYNGDEVASYTTNVTNSTTLRRTTTLTRGQNDDRIASEMTSFNSPNISSSGFAYDYASTRRDDKRLAVLTHSIDGVTRMTSNLAYDNLRRVNTLTNVSTPYTVTKTLTYASSGNKRFNKLSNVTETKTYGGTTTSNYNLNITYANDGKLTVLTDTVNSGAMSQKYYYDGLGRLVREDNKPLNQSITYTYNANGTMSQIKTYAYTTGTLGTVTSTKSCVYNTTYPTRLTTFNGKTIAYNTAGRVSCYDGKIYSWSNDRFTGYTQGTIKTGMETYTYTYNGKGQRISKGYSFFPGKQLPAYYTVSMTEGYTYDDRGRLVNMLRTATDNHESSTVNNLKFFYDASGVAGFVHYNGATTATYYYDKNIFGDIVGIRNSSNTSIGTYKYDAFGKCTTTGTNDLLYLNPFRYRGYFYDEETGCYYLQSRYYNPEWHRFLSPDHPDYIDVENLNCLDLYAYCGNDPINYVDPSGHLAEWIIAMIVGAVIGGVIGGVYGGLSAASQGASAIEVLGAIGIGMFTGAIMGAGAGAGGYLVGKGLFLTIGGICIGAGTGAIGGALNETFSQLLYDGRITDRESIGISAGIYAGINAFGTLLGAVGGDFSQFNGSSYNIWLGYIGIDYVFGGMTSATLFVADIGRFYKNKRRQ